VKSQKSPDGAQVEFVCRVEGQPRPQITWFRQTAIIKPSPDFQIYYDDNNFATLVIKEVFPEDAGTFTCVAKNCVGFASSSAELIVEHPLSDHGTEKHDRRSLSRESSLADIVEGIPPTFAQRPQTKTAEEGTNVELECRFVAIPEADVKWFFGGTEVQNSEHISIQYQADMHMYCSFVKINHVTKADEGLYEVVAKNREGEARNTLQLNVTISSSESHVSSKKKESMTAMSRAEAPIIVKALTPTVCKVGDYVRMETKITGSPKPKLKWYHNGKHFKASKNIMVKEESDNVYYLAICKAELKNDGDYVVRAENEAGTAQTSANLCVQGEIVEFVNKLEDKEVKEKDIVKLEVEVSSENTPVRWHKDGEVISESNEVKHYKFEKVGKKHSLIIERATVHDEGEYVCSVGEQECSCEISVIELPPEFTKKLTSASVTAGEKSIFEIEISKGDAKTRWFKNGTEIEFNEHIQLIIDGKKQRLEINSVELSDAGEISCSLGGTTECSARLEVEEPKVNFVAKLPPTTSGSMGQDVKITVVLSSSSVKVVWLK
jgi:DNA-directed RNA polymerase III subunit RPC5